MARLGELLVAARLVDQEPIDRALRAQVMWGGRLGTNLVELGIIDLEGLSRALGRKHGLPAALGRHFDRCDRELQERLGIDLARHWCVVPLLHVGPTKKIAVAAIDPLPLDAITQLSEQLACTPDHIVVSVAAEMRVRYHLERVYGIKRPSRYLRSRGKSITPFAQFDEVPASVDGDDDVFPVEIEEPDPPASHIPLVTAPAAPETVDDLAALIDEAIAQVVVDEPAEPPGRDRRTYLRTLADPPSQPPASALVGRIAVKKKAVSADDADGADVNPGPATLLDATRAIRRAGNRDRIAELVIDALERFVPECAAAVLLVIRGSVAISWKHFSRSDLTAHELVVPLDQSGLVPTVMERNATARASVDDLGLIDIALMTSLGASTGDLVVVPVAIVDRVLCVIATATEPDASVEAVEAVALAAAAAIARLMRNASR